MAAGENETGVGLIDGAEVVRIEEKDMANLSAREILLESLNIFREHVGVFSLVQLTLGIPLFILGFGFPLIYIFPLLRILSKTNVISDLENLLLLLITFLLATALQVFPMAANVYAVGLIYAGRRVSYRTVLKGAILRALPRMAAAFAYWTMISRSIIIILLIGLPIALFEGRSTQIIQVCVLLYLGWKYRLQHVCYNSAMCVFDEHYGMAALKAWRKLLDGKKKVASGIQIYLVAPFVSLYFLMALGIISGSPLDSVLDPKSWNRITVYFVGCAIVLGVLCVQLGYIVDGVVYASFKSYHGETIFSTSFLNDTAEGQTRRHFSPAVEAEHPDSVV